MNANSLNFPPSLVHGLLSSPDKGALHDDPFLHPPLTTPSRPPSLLVPHPHPHPHDSHSYQHFLPQHQRQLSSASSIASTLSATPPHHMSARARPLPQAFLDDPAFSSDPDENPHFSMNSIGDFLPANAPALDVHASMQDNLYPPQALPSRERYAAPSQHLRARTSAYDPQLPPSVYSNHPRARSHASPLPPPRAPPSNDTWAFRPFDDPLDDFPYSEAALASASNTYRDAKSRSHSESRPHSRYPQDVSPISSASSSPISPPMSLESTPSTFSHSSYSHTSYSQSAYSHSSHSHSSHSDASHASSGSSKMPSKKVPPAEPIVLLPPPAYSALPPPTDRPFPVTTASAPEVRQAPAPTSDVPLRPTSVPAPPQPPAPSNPVARPAELRKQRSRKTSAAPPLGGLDKIDELDETDPLGFAWHHDSRYEGVKKAAETEVKDSKDVAKALMEKEQRKKAKKAAAVNPNTTSFSISPGQIFPAFNPYHPQPTAAPTLHRAQPGSQSQIQPQPPLRSSPSPGVPDIPHQPSRQPSSSLSNGQLQPPQPFSRHSSSIEPGALSQPLLAPPSSRPASIHSQSSTHSQPQGSELPYAQQALPNPHPSNRAQTPPRHRLSRMAQDMVASGSAPQPITGSAFAGDPAFGASYGVNNGPPPVQQQNIYRASSGASSHSSHSSRSGRPPAPGLPPRLQQQQQMNAVPRPDTVLPPRHQAAKNRAAPTAPQPHYLPKRLVMPTPLQPMQGQIQAGPPQQQQVQGMPSYGSTSSGSSGDSVPMPVGMEYASTRPVVVPGPSQAQQQQQQQTKKAKEVPMSHGRNLLRKRGTVSGPPGGAAAAPDMGGSAMAMANGYGNGSLVNGVQVIGNGVGPAYVPSSNASAALFASKSSGSGGGSSSTAAARTARDAKTEWEMKQRERELKKERDREWQREMALESQAQKAEKEREREREREKGGRKLSKRR